MADSNGIFIDPNNDRRTEGGGRVMTPEKDIMHLGEPVEISKDTIMKLKNCARIKDLSGTISWEEPMTEMSNEEAARLLDAASKRWNPPWDDAMRLGAAALRRVDVLECRNRSLEIREAGSEECCRECEAIHEEKVKKLEARIHALQCALNPVEPTKEQIEWANQVIESQAQSRDERCKRVLMVFDDDSYEEIPELAGKTITDLRRLEARVKELENTLMALSNDNDDEDD